MVDGLHLQGENSDTYAGLFTILEAFQNKVGKENTLYTVLVEMEEKIKPW
jgi:beta-glucosidase